jgi:serine/threonine-protein kinase RsbW
VRDEGAGFDPDAVPDPRRDDRVLLHHGRGLLLMRELVDRVIFRRGGREVVLVFRWPAAGEPRR